MKIYLKKVARGLARLKKARLEKGSSSARAQKNWPEWLVAQLEPNCGSSNSARAQKNWPEPIPNLDTENMSRKSYFMQMQNVLTLICQVQFPVCVQIHNNQISSVYHLYDTFSVHHKKVGVLFYIFCSPFWKMMKWKMKANKCLVCHDKVFLNGSFTISLKSSLI